MIRLKLRFFGFVQGVGFRYTMQRLSIPHKVTGWARNEYDGTVSAQVQGEVQNVEKFIEALHNQRFIRIQRVDREEIPVVEGERVFRTDY